MFSGIRYIFGYSDETTAQAANEQSATSVAKENTSVTVPNVIESSPANKLEQTLNTATTKFTEQLLPQQASIEELQTSSHQLLPSITEQHEEDELRKKLTACVGRASSEAADQVDDDNDAFNEDSWELLDLVEKADDVLASIGLDSSVQVGDTNQQGSCKSTSGILKSQSSCGQNENGGNSQRRQKPKVSFGQSELVKSKQEENEQTNSNKAEELGSGVIEVVKKSNSVGDINCQKVPTLNYAKALSNKLTTEALLDIHEGAAFYSNVSSPKPNVMDASCMLGPVKRVRPSRVSTSSWSSNEEAEEEEEDSVERVINPDWKMSDEKVSGSNLTIQAKIATNAEDNESIASSDFSDCDYGFGGVNDYIMRPKKVNSKRGRTISVGSSSSTNRLTKSSRPEKKLAVAKAKLTSAIEAKNELKSTENKDSKADSSRSTKPKKKRMIMTTSNKSVCLTDFLKNKPGSNSDAPRQNAQNLAPEVANQLVSQQQPTINGGSTESSDIAEMDESWFVTPPPCFTKAAKVKDSSNFKVELPETKEDDQENALIENPSVYIANATSKSLTKTKKGVTAKLITVGLAKKEKCASGKRNRLEDSPMKFEDDLMNSGYGEDGAGKQVMPLNEAAEVSDKEVTSSGKDDDVSGIDTSDQLGNLITRANSKAKVTQKKASKCSGKRQAPTKSASVVLKRTDNKAWKNKFIIDAWDLDDDDDFDSDFDNMAFEPTKKRKSSKTKKGQQKQAKVKGDVEGGLSAGSNELASLDYSPSSSVELLSVKSLATSEFDVHDDLQPQVDLNIENLQPLDELKQNLSSYPKKDVEQRRPPTQVRPIEPERVPGWQLKRQRSKRRPLVSVAVVNKQQTARSTAGSPKTLKTKSESSSIASSSSRSTPTFIDRIGCSIVANLTNLTSGFVSSGTMNYCNPNGQANIMEGQEKTVVKRSNSNDSSAHFARKQLSRGSMRRQNICAKQGNSLRRPDRRLKLFATPNGCSINRKVHTNIH